MNAIMCELCGSNDVVKQGDYFVCQHCGTKYTLEDARKLLGTVKIDRTDETNNLLTLARRARDDKNCENAAKYYGLVLQNSPNNWEAAFFQVYYQAYQCKLAEIPSAANSLTNSMHSTFKLISENVNGATVDEAIDTVIKYTFDIADVMASATNEALHKAVNVMRGTIEWNERKCAINDMTKSLEDALLAYFPQKKSTLLSVRKLRLQKCHCGPDEEKRLKSVVASADPSFKSQSSGCYVATAVYGSYDCPQVWTLRRYRDYTLAETWYGRAFIRTYYSISPSLVKWFGETEWFKNMWKPKLDKMVRGLNEKGVADTPYQDRNW